MPKTLWIVAVIALLVLNAATVFQLRTAQRNVDRAITVAEDLERLATTVADQRDRAIALARACR